MDFYYLGNSGFLIRQDKELVLIDCMNRIDESILTDLDSTYKLTVLASHYHSDHFKSSVFELRELFSDVQYVLSPDIISRKKRLIPNNAVINCVSKGQSVMVNGIEVKAWGSTDEGVSFHIIWMGRHLFHAGDLNCWHWKDEATAQQYQAAVDLFESELVDISANVPELDAAFFPVDPRIGTDYYRGAVRFAQIMKPKQLIPMHFGAEFSAPEAFYKEIEPFTKVIQTKAGWSSFPW